MALVVKGLMVYTDTINKGGSFTLAKSAMERTTDRPSHSLTLYLSPATRGTGSKLKCEGSPTETGQDSNYEEEDSAEWQNAHN